MSVNTRKIRNGLDSFARLWSVEHMLDETFGVKGADLIELTKAYDRIEQLEAQVLSFARVVLGNKIADEDTRMIATQVVAQMKAKARKT